MKKLLLLTIGAGLALSATAQVKFVFPKDMVGKQVIVRRALIKDARTSREVDTLTIKKQKVTYPVDKRGGAQYAILNSNNEAISFYTAPGDKLTVDVKSFSPLEYSVSGSNLMNEIQKLNDAEKAIVMEFNAEAAKETKNQEAITAIQQKYYNLWKDYARNNPNNEAAIYAALHIQGPEFIEVFDALAPELKNSILYPMAETQKTYTLREIEAQKKLEALSTGTVDAPNFTLKNLEGKDVSLSDFRGKWVIIDFWGSWCGWCIKGFPKLKETYEAYKGELEVIGVDCNEPEEKWRKGVEKYKLPWVNVYNPEGSTILNEYGVTGFPTKAIITPEGKIADIVVGEDPEFYTKLAKLMGK